MDLLVRKGLNYALQLISIVKRWSGYFGLILDGPNYEDTFFQLLHEKKYDEAQKLALQHKNLDIDLVYKCKWRNSGITIQLIKDVLGKIGDKLWALNECSRTVPMTYEACRFILEFGLKEANLRLLYELGSEPPIAEEGSDKHEGKKFINILWAKRSAKKQQLLDEDITDDAIIGLIDFEHLNEQQRELCRCRQSLIYYRHALQAYESILGDYRNIQRDFDHVFYVEFRQKAPLEACLEFANNGDPQAVKIYLDFYTDYLRSHLLAILSNFPETLSPYQYRNILPNLRKGDKVFEWPKTQPDQYDWSNRDKTASVCKDVKEKNRAFANEFYEQNPHLKRFQGPMTSDLVSKWFIERALEMEKRTLLLLNATQLLEIGMSYQGLCTKNLKETYDRLDEFDQFVYDHCTEDNIYLSFTEFMKMREITDKR